MFIIHYWTLGRDSEGVYDEFTMDGVFATMAEALDYASTHSLAFDDAVKLEIVRVGFEGVEGRLV